MRFTRCEVFAKGNQIMNRFLVGFLFASLLPSIPSIAATSPGTVQHIKVHAASLEGNLEGDSADRDVSIYLPPSYATDKHRRYPVVYFLHGFTDSDDKWYGPTKHWINLPTVIDKALQAAGNREIIFVTPNAFTRYQGSMYSSSVTTGDWKNLSLPSSSPMSTHTIAPFLKRPVAALPGTPWVAMALCASA